MASKLKGVPERRQGLLVQRVGEEIIVYDRVSHKAHALNRTAALVFEKLDGQTDLDSVARDVGKALGRPPQKALVASAVGELAAADLLQPGALLPRRQVLRGLAAGLIPAVATIEVAAGPPLSCVPEGDPCVGGDCCSDVKDCVDFGSGIFRCQAPPPPT